MAGLGTTEILIILLVVLLLFGSTKLPQLARSLGRSARILRTETQGLHDDEPDDRPAQRAGGAREHAAHPHEEDARHRPPTRPQASLPPGRPPQRAPGETSDTRPAT
ncbi:twin-arginine translocase TatA/TatE family subunit [Actinomadura sp. GTD37]|uniref:twin-arginine translocase TatA/TatE family subunit n=1 Tax=Actinomadura sp. GTD37 TaxID=1778030 RepID=UPI0035BFCE00